MNRYDKRLSFYLFAHRNTQLKLAEPYVNYVLIFQFPETFFETVDEIREFEEKLTSSLPKTCEVDGFDTGSGTTNFFVFTQFPLAAFNAFRKYLGTNLVEKNLRASYREEDGEAYTNLWPYRDNRPFDLIYPHGIDPFSPKSKRRIPKKSPPGVSKFETPALEKWP